MRVLFAIKREIMIAPLPCNNSSYTVQEIDTVTKQDRIDHYLSDFLSLSLNFHR
ncbi:MAG: hypothetical protein ACI8RD_012012 [Bacillariaceae sp.]|jgi:hypothetical protein